MRDVYLGNAKWSTTVSPSRSDPFLLLPLPASPPYQLQGHLILKGNRYTTARGRRHRSGRPPPRALGSLPCSACRCTTTARWPTGKDDPAMASMEKLEFSVSLRDLPEKILIPRVALTTPDRS